VQGQAVMAGARRRSGQAVRGDLAGPYSCSTNMFCKALELALRIDKHGGEVIMCLLHQMAQRHALSGAGRSLDQAAARKQPVQVEVQRAVAGLAERDARPIGLRQGWLGHRAVPCQAGAGGCGHGTGGQRPFAFHAPCGD